MRKIMYLLILLLIFITSCKAQAQVFKNGQVIIGGSYYSYDDEEGKAAYWMNGKFFIYNEGQSIESITIKNGTIYAAGKISENICVYWINDKLHELPGCYDIDKIIIDNSNVYVIGWHEDEGFGYWKNGIFQENYIPSTFNNVLRYITIINDIVYMAGSYRNFTYNVSRACYWINGERYDLTDSDDLIGFGITIINNNLYIGSRTSAGNHNFNDIRFRYWINNNQYFTIPNIIWNRMDPRLFISENGDIFIVQGDKYWLNGNIHDLPDIERPQEDYLATHFVYNSKLYSAGNIGNTYIPCYWVDGVRYEIELPELGWPFFHFDINTIYVINN